MKRSDTSEGKHVVLGASPDPSRYAYLAVMMLREYGYDVVPVGLRPGTIGDIPILVYPAKISNVHTVTLYVSPEKQESLYDFIFGLNPKRIVFNPGAHNDELQRMAKEKGIETLSGCTLVMLRSGLY